jgi:superfamily II DNA helicase RecQ
MTVETVNMAQMLVNSADAAKLFEVQYFCTAKYLCRQQIIAEHFSWDTDKSVDSCNKCDNCLSRISDNAQLLPDAQDDVIELIEVIKSLTTSESDVQDISPMNVIDVYSHAKTTEMKKRGLIDSAA